jgi:hypothetical protein
MDLQAAETAHKKKEEAKVTWKCPCNGCAKAVKQERQRIIQEIENINLNSPSQLNGLGMKILVMEIVNKKNA